MRFPFWSWREVRKADIPKDDRDVFERYGEAVIGTLLTGGFNPITQELRGIYGDYAKHVPMRDWLTERSDSHERREQRLETAEWFILVFVFLGVIVEGVQLLREFGILSR